MDTCNDVVLVIQKELLQLKPMEFQLCQFVVDMVAPDWCTIAVGLEVEMRATNNESPVVELCTTVFQNYLKCCQHPTWKHILEVMESEAVGRKNCAIFIKTILPGTCSKFVIIFKMLFNRNC